MKDKELTEFEQEDIDNDTDNDFEVDDQNAPVAQELPEKDIHGFDNSEADLSVVEEQEGSSDDTSPERIPEKRWQRLKKDREEKRILAAEIDYLSQKNAEMEYMLRQSLDVSKGHSNKVAEDELLRAKNYLTQALEQGDPKAVSDATYLISQATQRLSEIEKTKDFTNSPPPSPTQFIRKSKDVLAEWLDSNPEVVPDTPEYNPRVAKLASGFIKKLENRLRNNKQEHLIASPEYFNVVDQYMDSIYESNTPRYFGKVTTSRNDNRMSPITTSGGYGLTRDEKETAAACNMTQAEYAKYKAANLKKQNNRGL